MITSDAAKRKRAESASEQSAIAAAPWSADRGDGTYRNPILFADYSDPDAIRVGGDYWMIASSFGHVPGLPILHSRDLVNWSLVNHALPQLVPVEHFRRPRHGAGVWASTIRFHRGKFWIFYPDPDFGLYVITADDPRGTWSAPRLILAGKGLIDPCPLWDDDGRGYLVHGWARSRSGINNLLTLRRLAPDNMAVVGDGMTIVDGAKLDGWHTLEGPKLYKRDGRYYIFAPAGGVAEGYQAVFRAERIDGPYEAKIVLEQGRTSVNGPHQGAWVDTPEGEHWFLHFQELPAYGRVVHLQPMRWNADGWPVMGEAASGASCGEPVLLHRKPALPTSPVAVPASSDDFRGPRLGLQWQWQGNPEPHWATLLPSGGLRLACVPVAPAESLWHAPHVLLQKFPAPAFEATVEMQLHALADGDSVGLVVFGHDYAWIGLRRERGELRLVLRTCEGANRGAPETEQVSESVDGGAMQLRAVVAAGGVCRFSWRQCGGEFAPLGSPFQAKSSTWVGAKVGLFALRAEGADANGSAAHAEVSWFRVGRGERRP